MSVTLVTAVPKNLFLKSIWRRYIFRMFEVILFRNFMEKIIFSRIPLAVAVLRELKENFGCVQKTYFLCLFVLYPFFIIYIECKWSNAFSTHKLFRIKWIEAFIISVRPFENRHRVIITLRRNACTSQIPMLNRESFHSSIQPFVHDKKRQIVEFSTFQEVVVSIIKFRENCNRIKFHLKRCT